MVDMARSVSRLGSEFDAFLFAPIGADRNGMLLSVLSAFARLGVDPWQEAAKLARMPLGTAAQQLTALIAALPAEPSAPLDPPTIAARLIALLPRSAIPPSLSRVARPGVAATTDSRTIVFMVFIACLLGAQLIVASHLLPALSDDSGASASGAAVSRMTPPIAGQGRSSGLGQ
jgi:hypothetical protein